MVETDPTTGRPRLVIKETSIIAIAKQRITKLEESDEGACVLHPG